MNKEIKKRKWRTAKILHQHSIAYVQNSRLYNYSLDTTMDGQYILCKSTKAKSIVLVAIRHAKQPQDDSMATHICAELQLQLIFAQSYKLQRGLQ